MKKNVAKTYYVYILECANGAYYTGITTDIERRFTEHKTKNKGAKYTSAFGVKNLMAVWKTKKCDNPKSLASKLEYRIKALERKDKEEIIANKKAFKIIFMNNFEFNSFIRFF